MFKHHDNHTAHFIVITDLTRNDGRVNLHGWLWIDMDRYGLGVVLNQDLQDYGIFRILRIVGVTYMDGYK